MYEYYVLRVLLKGFVLLKYHFWLFFGSNMNTVMGVVIYMYLKYFPDLKILNIYWFMV